MAGGTGDYKSDINITPLVDVVLVLLIIFMVITPLLQMGYDVKVPPKAPPNMTVAEIPPDQLVVSLLGLCLDTRRAVVGKFSSDNIFVDLSI